VEISDTRLHVVQRGAVLRHFATAEYLGAVRRFLQSVP
jgi:hypothetical protein